MTKYPFTMSDLDLFQLREPEAGIPREHIEALANAAAMETLFFEDGSCLGVFGKSVFPWGTAVEIFLLPSIDVQKNQLEFQRIAKQYIKDLLQQYVRVQTHSIDTDISNRWMQSIGLELEGRLSKYGPGGVDYCLWAQVNHGQ